MFLLSNLPTALPVDRFTTWEEHHARQDGAGDPRGRGVLPLSYSELARVHPSLWAGEQAVKDSAEERG